MTRKLEVLPEKRGIWLWSYDEIKYKTPFEWFATGLLGFLALTLGLTLAVTFWEKTKDATLIGRAWPQIVPAGIITFGLLHFPAALIYLFRKARHQPVDVWECETPNDPALTHRRLQKEDPSSENGSPD